MDSALVPTTEQTWDWPEAGDVLARCPHSLMVMEIFGRVHAHDERIECFLPTLRAVIEQTRPTAAYVPNATRVVRPGELLEDELAPFANVRFFRVEDDDRLVMDTLGLHVFRLPDAQCVHRSAEHEPNEIGAMLHDLAGYLLDRGDIIEDGDTIGDLPWRCRREVSALGPERRVLNLTPA